MAASQVVVRNLSNDSSEESVQDYFSFCGDIQSVKITQSVDGRSKEAEIKFESAAAASTAVLLNNALVEGRNIVVELIIEEGAESNPTAGHNKNTSSTSLNDSINSANKSGSVLNEITDQAKSVASQVSSATRDLNAKYDITGKLKNAYDTAAVTTSTTFEKLDTQYNIRGNSSKAFEATKTGISSMYRQMSGLWSTASTSSLNNNNTGNTNMNKNNNSPSTSN